MAKSEKEPKVSEEAATPVATPKAAAPANTSSESSGKRKGKQPGRPPHKGKKLKAQIANIYAKVTKEGQVSLDKAITILKQVKRAKFDESIEIHMSLGIDSAQSDQMIRGSVALPHGVGKKVRVLVFCQGDNTAKATSAGADFVGEGDLIKKIQSENWLDFDVVLATQDMMGQVSRLGKVLGPRGLMPTPKAGTVIGSGQDIAAIVKEFKSGKVEYRSDKGGNVHAGIGKISFDTDKIASNALAFVEQVRASKPTGIRGNYIKSVTISATMCPGIPVTI